MRQTLGLVTRLFAFCAFIIPSLSPAFDAETAGFTVRVGEVNSGYQTFGFFVLPEEALKIEARATSEAVDAYELTGGSEANATRIAANQWEWKAPVKPGLYPLTVTQKESGESMTLNLFVLVPLKTAAKGSLNGYRIGKYPAAKPGYDLPKGFIEVTRANEDTLVSPHFRVKQFLCKQSGGYPKYVVLREKLVQKLELLLDGVNRRGHAVNSFHIMSGYRTPHYNHAIGNVKYSRHQWGDAADILLDEIPHARTKEQVRAMDAARFSQIVDETPAGLQNAGLVGGVGKYKANKAHGVFVHVDVRGQDARWGH